MPTFNNKRLLCLICPVGSVYSDSFENYNVKVHWKIIYYHNSNQRAKKVMTDSPGLVDFALRLVNFCSIARQASEVF